MSYHVPPLRIILTVALFIGEATLPNTAMILLMAAIALTAHWSYRCQHHHVIQRTLCEAKRAIAAAVAKSHEQ